MQCRVRRRVRDVTHHDLQGRVALSQELIALVAKGLLVTSLGVHAECRVLLKEQPTRTQSILGPVNRSFLPPWCQVVGEVEAPTPMYQVK